jgi:hypothetical protein
MMLPLNMLPGTAAMGILVRTDRSAFGLAPPCPEAARFPDARKMAATRQGT